jgi:hypothetical protein
MGTKSREPAELSRFMNVLDVIRTGYSTFPINFRLSGNVSNPKSISRTLEVNKFKFIGNYLIFILTVTSISVSASFWISTV